MQPIRQIFEDAPDAIPVPEEMRHRRVEFILWPLDEADLEASARSRPRFNIADVDVIDTPSREQRNIRRQI
ncbi:hypothetical protein [Methylosarcina fibrata]|uniref:hypothetical protein n=1 Tax=Methylosarcina fibrata TaxID=105972 RepID=UPI0003723721|nr:hypothetical protein [Methylosarcina fibrata]